MAQGTSGSQRVLAGAVLALVLTAGLGAPAGAAKPGAAGAGKQSAPAKAEKQAAPAATERQGTVAGAAGLTDALSQAYQSNPTLDAARAKLRSVDETVPQALSASRPSVGLSANAGPGWTQTDTAAYQNWNRTNPASVGVQMEQPLYKGGRISAGISQAENLVQAERAVLHGTEQTVLLAAATAYLDVVRAQAVLALNINNEQVLKRRLEAEGDRFRVGEITRTDVSQAESRLAKAVSDRIQSEGGLSISRATYARVVGPLTVKTLIAPKLTYPLPATLDEVIALARDKNPSVVASLYGEKAAQDRIDTVEGQLLPTISLKAAVSRAQDRQLRNDFANSASLMAQVTIPLDNGGIAAQTREARQTASQKRIQILEARQQAEENAIRGWQTLTTARASIVSRQAQVKAAELALEGVRQEAAVGSRTVLDTLNAEQELLDARVSMVTAEHDEAVAVFTLLSAVGQLTAQELRLPVPYYDYEAHYHAVRDKWFGLGIED